MKNKMIISPQELERLYIDCQLSTFEIAEMFEVVHQTVSVWLNKHNIPTRNASSRTRIRYRRDTKYTMDDSFWNKWTPEFSWFLGLMFADGNIHPDRARAYLTSKDIKLLKQVRDLLKSNFKIQTKATTPQLIINSMDRVEHLEGHGITKSKTYTVKFPYIPDEFMSHFVRGFIDGDGWLTIRKNGQAEFGVEISSESFAFDLYKVLIGIPNIGKIGYYVRDRTKEIRKDGRNIRHKRPIISIRAWGKTAISIFKWLYMDSSPSIRYEVKYNRVSHLL